MPLSRRARIAKGLVRGAFPAGCHDAEWNALDGYLAGRFERSGVDKTKHARQRIGDHDRFTSDGDARPGVGEVSVNAVGRRQRERAIEFAGQDVEAPED